MKKILLALVALLVSGMAYAAPVYTLRFFNVDDGMDGFITNATHTNTHILSAGCCGGNTGDVNITGFVTGGLNSLNIQDVNIHGGGWTIGWEFKIDGIIKDSEVCGTFGVFGCNNN